ncbi:A/G-specific adenine glycosylase [Lacinutrix sp. C3R15]|uniref:A/G-specific adenine glycosylase n=1 Tax=Flavobacteriaceae TaxID=49546 RepID=UPI001C096B5C|nr:MULTISPECIES: A/G-specific adenine glycosylase [Flavobacteriaceae]MBU2938985.1 A/G-specific adenine glycosylase [Lacinutrix sp. C3R15]MDO6622300.1 A/G-specific adenine glycosylase [Oceanihabitans sp. 1_MG-2023]
MTLNKTLTHWYSVNKRDLPWRRTKNPYFIWLSEIILQQTKIEQGLPYYEAFVTKFPTIFSLAAAKESEVLKLWQGLGYYSRARNLHATAKYVVTALDGIFPDNYKDLIKLKGIGDYTASAIASISFNEVCAVVDGNVYRAFSRYFGIDTPINSTQGQKEFKALAQKLIDKEDPAEFNQAIMEFGARQCKPKNPDCSVCPLQNGCVALLNNTITQLPVKKKSIKPVKKHFNFLVFVSSDRKTILQKREGKGIWQKLYQFPLIESTESLSFNKMASHLNTHELTQATLFTLSLYNEEAIIHKLSHQHLHTKFWIIEVDTLPVNGVLIDKTKDYPVPVLVSNFMETFNF